MKISALREPSSTSWQRPLRAISLAAILGLCFPTTAPVYAADAPDAITLAQTPPAVQKTIQANIGNGKTTLISKGEEDGIMSYGVDFTKGAESRDLRVGEDGALLKIQVALAETPPAVQRSIQMQLGTEKANGIEKTFESNEISYVVDYTTKDGRESQFTIGENGALLEIEIALAEAPAPVQTTLTAQMGGGTLNTLTKIIEDRITYEADFTKDGKDGGVIIGPNGGLLNVQITIEEAPGPARKTILERLGDGKILTLWKSFEKRGKFLPVKVEAVKDGKTFNFSVAEKGHFIGMDE